MTEPETINFAPTGPGLDERLTGLVASYEGITVTLRPEGLDYMQGKFLSALVLANPRKEGEDDDDAAARLAEILAARDNWQLRFCVESATGIDLEWEKRKIGKKEYRVLTLECLDRIPEMLRDVLGEKIDERSNLNQAARDKVVFTSASPAT